MRGKKVNPLVRNSLYHTGVAPLLILLERVSSADSSPVTKLVVWFVPKVSKMRKAARAKALERTLEKPKLPA